jgi:2'-5' RNA ligase
MRAFLALEPDPPALVVLKNTLRQLRTSRVARDVKWVGEDNLHMTMRFLGEIDDAQKNKLVELLAAQVPAMGTANPLRMSEPRLFPKPSQARVIACMLERDAWLSRLAEMCEQDAQHIGLPAERRPFNGHITLGRTRESFQGRDFEAWPATSTLFNAAGLTLFKSALTPRGAIYEQLAFFKFVQHEGDNKKEA